MTNTGKYSKVKVVTALVAGFILVVALLVLASLSNHNKFYLKFESGAVEIWQGRYAPLGKDRILILPGAQAPVSLKAKYSKIEINVVIFNYYIERADILLEAPDMPDFTGIRNYLTTALSYAVSAEMRKAAKSRLDTIDMMLLLYKADVAASKGTLAEFEKALAFLNKAAALDLDTSQSDLIKKKIESVKELRAAVQDQNAHPQ